MSVKYDLLKQQIAALDEVIDDEAELVRSDARHDRSQRLELLRGARTMLQYVHDEGVHSNLNVWEDECDHAANEMNG